MSDKPRAMRDVLIEGIFNKMLSDENIFFVSADFGARPLDQLRNTFKDRFINVGIAEQNLINVSAGLAHEGYTVFAYAICPFITMRCFEQIRTNLAIASQIKPLNVNLIGVGAGISYDVSGPTHHCLEDLILMSMLPGFSVFSPSDWRCAGAFLEHTLTRNHPKYLRFDSKLLPAVYHEEMCFDFDDGFCEMVSAESGVCLVSTGYMTHSALRIASAFTPRVGVIDIFMLKTANQKKLLQSLKKYQTIFTLEEGFIGRGGLDTLISSLLQSQQLPIKLSRFGFNDRYCLELGDREHIHKLNNMDENTIIQQIKASCL